MIRQFEINLSPKRRGFHLVTQEVMEQVAALPETGIFHLFIQHTSAGITINENADPSVRRDFHEIYNRLIPEDQPYYTHNQEGSDDMPAHVKSVLTGNHLSIPISRGKLNLGTWQGIFLCEFRNHEGSRKLIATIYS